MKKFRAWSQNYNKWIYFTIQDLLSAAAEVSEAVIDWKTLGRPVGVNDKNDKELYERDIIKHKVSGNQNLHGEFGFKEIIYRNGLWVASYLKSEKGKVLPRGYTACELHSMIENYDKDIVLEDNFLKKINEIEIVGNIYKNPEYLK